MHEAYDEATRILTEKHDQLVAVAEGLLLVETLDREQFLELYNGTKTPEALAEELRVAKELRAKKDAEEAKESKELRKKAEEEQEKQKLAEAQAALQENSGKGLGDGKFKPIIMTYDDITKEAKPIDDIKLAKDDDKPADDDLPSEEELKVYDTDYFADDVEAETGNEDVPEADHIEKLDEAEVEAEVDGSDAEADADEAEAGELKAEPGSDGDKPETVEAEETEAEESQEEE